MERGDFMFFHFVKKGDSLYKLSKHYGVSIKQLVDDNDLSSPNDLVVGQCLIIKLKNRSYRPSKGETLQQVANNNFISVKKLVDDNPYLKNMTTFTGEEKVMIDYDLDQKYNLGVNGYCYTDIKERPLSESLKYLTYLSIFSYRVNFDGSLNSIADEKLIDQALNYNVAPIMVITNTKENGGFDSELVSKLLTSSEYQEKLLNQILTTLKSKRYYGLNIDFEYVNPNDKDNFRVFVNRVKNRIKPEGFDLSIALAPKVSSTQKGLLYEAHDYEELGKIVDRVIIMTYEWGYTYGPAMAVAPLDKVRQVIDYAKQVINPKKIYMGIPNYGYDFILPYDKTKAAKSIGNKEAVDLAIKEGAEIKFDETSETPYFHYKKDDVLHIVHFEDPCSLSRKFNYAIDSGIGGISIWTINQYYRPLSLLIDYYFTDKKVIDRD